MFEPDGIETFLSGVRRRLVLRAGLETAGYGAAALAVVLAALAVTAANLGPAEFWPKLTAFAVAVAILTVVAVGVAWPFHALRDDLTAARRAGALRPELASDLLSAVELGAPPSPGAPAPAHSPALVRAFRARVADRLAPISADAVVPWRPALWALGAVGLAAAVTIVAGLLWPTLGRGWRTLMHHPSLFEGAAVSAAPLVGEVRLTYEYPAYTGLPPRTVEGSTGDIAAVKGSRVHLETSPLREARKALLLFGESGERAPVAAQLRDGRLSADLQIVEDASYRFWLDPGLGRALREERSHHITAEADAPPRVEIQGPADRLELATPRPIEIGYSASDDFGLGAVDLIVRVGDRAEQRVPLRDGAGARAVQGRTLWDPSGAGLTGAERIAYRVEARDRDAVSGPKVGVSRTLYVIIQSPGETLDDRLQRQRELLELLLTDLADRVEQAPAPGGPRADEDARTAALAAVHEAEQGHLAMLGRLLDEDKHGGGGLGKALRAALGGIADRMERILRDETQALAKLRIKVSPGARARLDVASAKEVAELEGDVLLLDDLIGREQLEDLANLGKELTETQQRLEDLLERYKKTKDPALRAELGRQARELRSRIENLAHKIAAVQARNEVPQEWRNLPDMKSLQAEARKVDDMLEHGDEHDLERALGQLGDDLRQMRKMLDQNLDGFASERFPQENRAVGDLMKKIGDIEGDERALQKETQAIADKQEAEVQRRLQSQMDDFVKREVEKVEKLKQRLTGVATGEPESAVSEELERARDSAKQLRRLFAERDLAEAKGEAERAESSLERAGEHLDDMAEARRNRKPARGESDELEKRALAVGEARAMAQQIADDLDKLMPKPSDTLSPGDRAGARAQADKQAAIGGRTGEVADEAARRLGKLPGMDKAEDELKGAAARMRQAGDALKRDESKPAAMAERDAADRLAKLRDSMRERSMGGAEQHHDPVRIPGADDSTAPRAWRQELLDAMKEKAPERYRDDVRRYYEELVK
jgi:hypothetical protein